MIGDLHPDRSVAPILLVGVGSAMRGDDGVGPAVVACVAKRLGPTTAVDVAMLDGEPARIIEAWSGRELTVLVDAVRRGAAPGESVRMEILDDVVPVSTGAHSTHSGGLADAISLGRVLGRLPHRLVLFGVEPQDMTIGAGLSPAVAAAIPALVDSILSEVGS